MHDFDRRQAQLAAERWRQRETQRAANRRGLAEGGVATVETAERIGKRMARLERAAAEERAARLTAAAAPVAARAVSVPTVGLERVIGRQDFVGVGFLELGFAVARFVGRVVIREGNRTVGFGTGSMVSPRLLLTNNHVLEDAATARDSLVEFDFQQAARGGLLPVRRFRLLPETFFLTDSHLDYTLVAVAEQSEDREPLARYGWNRLVAEEGKALIGDPLNIIQHPQGRAKELVVRSNELVDLLDDFAHYVTDTEPGSSGSPVFNDQWEMVALHHSGVPATDAQGRLLDLDGNLWDGRDPARLRWVANEGVRVSRLVDHLRRATLDSGEKRRLRTELLEREAPDPLEALVEPVEAPPPRPETNGGNGRHPFVLTLPLRVSIELAPPEGWPGGGGGLVHAGAGAGAAATVPPPPAAGPLAIDAAPVSLPAAFDDEAVSIDPDYSTRRGYDAAFLGAGWPVPLPALSPALSAAAAVNRDAADEASRHVLPYHHYSVVMNAERRLAFFTAVNIDGAAARRPRRETDRWFIDPRIEREAQAGNEVYADNPLDRGHLVRRLDPAWGPDDTVAKVANDDTFHFTNCAPQHQGFNREATTWAGLEDYILENTDREDVRVSVFTGPVFRHDDAPYRRIRLPQQFWKVVAFLREDGSLSATAYLLSQAHLIDGLAEEAFAFGAYRTFQVPVARVGELTGLDFGALPAADPLAAPSEEEAARPAVREIREPGQMLLGTAPAARRRRR